MSKFIKLLTSAYVNGRPRRPDEGVLHLEDAEADRLLADGSGEDVTKDFSADERKAVPVQSLDANASSRPDLALVDHQTEIAPSSADVPDQASSTSGSRQTGRAKTE